MDLYAENILEHYREPKNRGSGLGASSWGEEDNPACGDRLKVHFWIKEGNIQKIEWEGEGCAISQAAMSMLSEELTGKSVEEVLNIKKNAIYDLLGIEIGPRRFKCALLCLHTIKNTLKAHKGEKPQSWIETVA